jgi:hypothetical protein
VGRKVRPLLGATVSVSIGVAKLTPFAEHVQLTHLTYLMPDAKCLMRG